jgi:3',5'-cyclic AMP phosphodiesterase CpdA
MRRAWYILTAAALLCAQDLRLPNNKDSVQFAVLGDTGTGDRPQYQTAEQVERMRGVFPFEFVLMLGDNLYGGEKPRDFNRKFEVPYASMLKDGVKFYASLGNHDDPNQRYYENFNMDGKRFYTFKPKDGVRFFGLDSNYMDKEQIDWLEKELAGSGSDWKIAFFHHPLYSSGERHGPDEDLRRTLEPLFIKYGVSVVFTGHEHFYERLKPQKGIHYFIAGSSAKLRQGNIRRTAQTAKGFDSDNTFMLCEIDGDRLHFQTITRAGRTIDSGVIQRPGASTRSRSAASPATSTQ